MELKSIANRVSMSMPSNNLDMLHNAMMNEMYTKCYDDKTKDMSPEQIATDLLTEHHSLAAPHVAAFIKAYREQADDTKALLVKDFQASIKIFELNKKSATAPAAEPAPATTVQPAASVQPPAATAAPAAQAPAATTAPAPATEPELTPEQVAAEVKSMTDKAIRVQRGELVDP